jgi:hypothetical protein
MSRANRWSLSAVAFVIAMAILGAIVERATHRMAASVSGQFGYTPDPEGTRAFLATLGDEKYFSQAGAEAMQEAKGVDTFLYRQLDAAHRARYGKPFVVGRQQIGDCVAWGAAHAVAVSEAVSFSLGKLPEPPLMPATEALYGGARVEARGKPGDGAQPYGGFNDGATGFGAAKFLREFGVVYRQKYPSADLTQYSGERAKQWGAYGCGGQGDAGRMDAEAKKHPLRHVVAIRSWSELAAALESGYPVTLASSQGFTSTRSKEGICEASGVWQHQMCAIGIRHRKNGAPDDLCLILNSWGPSWVGPKENKYPSDQPDGSFWARRSVVERMLEDAWAIGDTDGFKYRDIHHGNWLQPAPPEKQAAKPHTARLVADVHKLGL